MCPDHILLHICSPPCSRAAGSACLSTGRAACAACVSGAAQLTAHGRRHFWVTSTNTNGTQLHAASAGLLLAQGTGEPLSHTSSSPATMVMGKQTPSDLGPHSLLASCRVWELLAAGAGPFPGLILSPHSGVPWWSVNLPGELIVSPQRWQSQGSALGWSHG